MDDRSPKEMIDQVKPIQNVGARLDFRLMFSHDPNLHQINSQTTKISLYLTELTSPKLMGEGSIVGDVDHASCDLKVHPKI